VVNAALDDYFPPSMGVQVIAEPGRYYVASAYTLATLVHSKRDTMYYINDGVYGSFNCILYDHAVVTPVPLEVCPVSDLSPSQRRFLNFRSQSLAK
jgi:ornithine decarboxylase